MKDFKRFNINLVSGDVITNGKDKFITLVESDGSIEQVNEGGIYTDWELSEFCYRPMPIPELVSENCEVEFFTEINDGEEVTLWRPDIKWMREFIETSDKVKQVEPHILGDAIPKEGEWWMGYDGDIETTVAILIDHQWWPYSESKVVIEPFKPTEKMIPSSMIDGSVGCDKCKEPKEVVSLQIDGLPPLDSVVYLSPSKESGNGEPGRVAKNPGRKVKIYAHFVDDRNINLASYVSCDDKPVIGGVAIASAFETEEEKREREIGSILEDVFSSAPGMDKEIARRIAAGLHGKDYYKGEK